MMEMASAEASSTQASSTVHVRHSNSPTLSQMTVSKTELEKGEQNVPSSFLFPMFCPSWYPHVLCSLMWGGKECPRLYHTCRSGPNKGARTPQACGAVATPFRAELERSAVRCPPPAPRPASSCHLVWLLGQRKLSAQHRPCMMFPPTTFLPEGESRVRRTGFVLTLSLNVRQNERKLASLPGCYPERDVRQIQRHHPVQRSSAAGEGPGEGTAHTRSSSFPM